MELKKRECPVKMRLIPYGAGWTDLYVDFGEGELYFIISNSMGSTFNDLVRSLYHLHPDTVGAVEEANDLLEYKIGTYEEIDGKWILSRVLDIGSDEEYSEFNFIPWKASFTWDEEGSYSSWVLEKTPNEEPEFNVKITIDVYRSEEKHYEYTIPFADICYAVADASTKAMKKHGFWGYHYSTYTDDIMIRHLLFIKAIALCNMEARELTYYDEKGHGETSDFNKELELLLFDM